MIVRGMDAEGMLIQMTDIFHRLSFPHSPDNHSSAHGFFRFFRRLFHGFQASAKAAPRTP
jgi:hypothetical protein